MRRCFRRSVAFLLSLGAYVGANAAEISAIKLDRGGTALVIVGDIQAGDAAKFGSEASKYDDAFVLLESDGGALGDALKIGETIRLKGYSTAVINGSHCNSACALIWLAGSPRGLSLSGKVGFHAAYTDKSGPAQESGVANAMVGRYLTLLNLPEKAVIFATSSPPSELSWLTASNYASTGIDVKVIGDIDLNDAKAAVPQPPPIVTVTSPAANPPSTMWRRVNNWEIYVDKTLNNGCFLFTSYTTDTLLRLGVNRLKNNYYLMFTNPDWKSLVVGNEYDVHVQFDDKSPWDAPAKAIQMGTTVALMVPFADANFWQEFKTSQTLNITRNERPVAKLSVSDSKGAYDELVACQRYEDSVTRSRDPFAQ